MTPTQCDIRGCSGVAAWRLWDGEFKEMIELCRRHFSLIDSADGTAVELPGETAVNIPPIDFDTPTGDPMAPVRKGL